MKRIVLASASPRRHSLLSQAGIVFDVIAGNCSEDMEMNAAPEDIVMMLAQRKAACVVKASNVEAVIIAADTIVWHEGKHFGKPLDNDEAFSMLKNLQGKQHYVYTGVCVIDNTPDNKSKEGSGLCFADYAKVWMRNVSEEEIHAYIRTGEHLGKAGAYAIQEKGAFFVEKIEGDYNTVVGLPLVKVCMCLKNLGVDITSCW